MRREVALTALAAILIAATLPAMGERVVLEGPLVRVNDQVITDSDFAKRLRQELSQIPAQPTGEELEQFAENLLNGLVDELVLSELASQKHVEVEDSMVDNAIASLREDNGLQDDEAWQQALESSGITEEQLRERYRRNIKLQRTVQSEVRPVEVTEEELRRQYENEKERFAVPEKVVLEQLFFEESPGGADHQQVLRRATGLVERVRDGADLKAEATLAGVELQELGAIPVEDCRPDLAAALDGLEAGGITDPLPVPGGVQVVDLVERIPAGYQPFDEVVDQLRRQRAAEDYESQTKGLVERLKEEYIVVVHPERIPAILAGLTGA
ncbi:MAG: SurA N-terminal domain-containing protein [Acidobacteriota bacterium]